MASIITNNASMTALQTLKTVQSNLTDTQSRVSTGLKVQSAKDNAAYYSIAQTMRGDAAAFNALSENLSIVGASVSVARQGMEEIGHLTKQILEKVSLAQANESVDRALIQKDIDDLFDQIASTRSQTTYNGQSLLESDGSSTANLTVVTGVKRENGELKTTSFEVQTAELDSFMNNLRAVNVETATNSADLDAALTMVESQIAWAMQFEVGFGMAEKRIENHQSFNSKLVDKFDSGVGSLVDADMNKEAARLSALQVQEQLATQALSIANQAPQSILSLFR